MYSSLVPHAGLLIRRILTIFAAAGLAASAVVYFATFAGLTLNGANFLFAFALHVGVFALFAPMCWVEREAIKDHEFFMKGFAAGKPTWAVPTVQFLGAFAVANFVLFLILSRASSPEILHGQFVLNNHGTITKVLTESEYSRLKADELRLFASGWVFFYSAGAIYWWFPRSCPAISQSPAPRDL